MSASRPFTLFQQYARPTYLGITRHRFVAVGFGALALATIGGAGIALVPQTRQVTYQPATPREEGVTSTGVTPGLSPLRDAWYLEDRAASTSAPGRPHLIQPGGTVKDRWFEDVKSARAPAAKSTVISIAAELARDRWYLDERPDVASGAP